MKKIDLTKTVFELVKEYPELQDIMAELGFKEISKKAMLNSVGKLMTIPKGAAMKNIPMDKIIAAFAENGFEIEGAETVTEQPDKEAVTVKTDSTDRKAQLKNYLKRLNSGEDLESVRADFVANFSDVEASEIMEAEQELLKEGTPLEEVQQLCDVHSALFHGATREEQIANAEKAAIESMKAKQTPQANYSNKKERAAELCARAGHPLNTLTKENDALSAIIDEIKNAENASDYIDKVRDLFVHYAKKGDLLYPLLKVKYEISGPSDVMWTVDDEIRDELGALAKDSNRNSEWFERFNAVIERAVEMIYKEQNILFPICAVNFTEDEWKGIYRDSKDYALCFGVEADVWTEAETTETKAPAYDGEIVMPGGHMTVEQLTALLNTIPLEITFIDADNINRFFNEGPKVFKRPGMAIDREVFSCHPPKIEPMVRQIISDFRSGERDFVPVWMEKNGRTMLVKYMAVRDSEGKYVGTVELVQDMEFAKEHFAEKE
ncbi:MAG: DUF438 domain-containing protein [Eubacterium sp.]|nr:DUF438 domain-containing protein [Eubacterium sp.]